MIERVLKGKQLIIADPFEKNVYEGAYKAILAKGGLSLKREMQKAQAARIEAKRLGFDSVEEYISISEWGSKEMQKLQDKKIISQVEKEAQMTFIPEVRKQILQEAKTTGKVDISKYVSRPKVTPIVPKTLTPPPSGVVSLPPSKYEQFKKEVQQEGYIKGGLGFIGKKTSGFISESKFSPFRRTGYAKPVGKGTKLMVETAPYFTPVGPALLVGAGAEEIFTKRGRLRIKEKQKKFESEAYGARISTVFSYGQPIAEIGLGLAGGIALFRGARQVSKLKKEIPITKFKAEVQHIPEKDIEGISLISRTKIGKKEYLSVFGGISKEGKIALTKGKGVVLTEEGAYPFKSLGLGKKLGKAKVVKPGKIKIKKEIGEGFGVKTLTIADEKAITSKFIGTSIKEGETTYVLAGKPKLRIEPGEVRTIFRPTITGEIKKAKVPKEKIIEFEPFEKTYIGKKPKVKVPEEKPVTQLQKEKQFQEQQEKVLKMVGGMEETAKVKAISEVKEVAKVKVFPIKTDSQIFIQPPKIKVREETMASVFSKQLFGIKEKPKLKGIIKEKEAIVPILSFTNINVFKEKQDFYRKPISQLKIKEKGEGIRTFSIPSFFPSEKPPEKISKVPPLISLPLPERDIKRKVQAYYGYVKVDSTKGKPKWKKVTPKKATKRAAVDYASEVVDKSLSARFKVSPVKRKVKGKKKFVMVEKQKLSQPTGYWEQNKKKFRTFKQRKGVRTKIPNQAIELQKYRLDTPGETRMIQREKRVGRFFGL